MTRRTYTQERMPPWQYYGTLIVIAALAFGVTMLVIGSLHWLAVQVAPPGEPGCECSCVEHTRCEGSP